MSERRRSGWKAGLLLAAVWAASTGGVGRAQGEPQVSPEQKAALAAWTKAMTPGKPHQDLAGQVGTWEGKVSMWDAPGAAPQISQARAERTMGLGGRVLLDHWRGTMMGMPFEGLGTTGYDNASGKWWSTWSDNFSTGVMTGAGNCDGDPRRGCTYAVTAVDPLTGKEKRSRQTRLWPTPDEERMEMYDRGPDGKEWKAMEIALHRVKK
jgi:hypothetical protein